MFKTVLLVCALALFAQSTAGACLGGLAGPLGLAGPYGGYGAYGAFGAYDGLGLYGAYDGFGPYDGFGACGGYGYGAFGYGLGGLAGPYRGALL